MDLEISSDIHLISAGATASGRGQAVSGELVRCGEGEVAAVEEINIDGC